MKLQSLKYFPVFSQLQVLATAARILKFIYILILVLSLLRSCINIQIEQADTATDVHFLCSNYNQCTKYLIISQNILLLSVLKNINIITCQLFGRSSRQSVLFWMMPPIFRLFSLTVQLSLRSFTRAVISIVYYTADMSTISALPRGRLIILQACGPRV